jgi:hypothetical protein
MNRLISAVMAVLMAAAGSAAGGYWNPAGVVPVGDARIPAQFVGWLITIVGGIGGLSAGGSVPWKTWLAALVAKLKASGPVSVVIPAPSTPDGNTTSSKALQRSIVADVPIEVEHLQGCVYHLRVVLKDNAKAQDLLDQIAVMVGRATADVQTPKTGGDL